MLPLIQPRHKDAVCKVYKITQKMELVCIGSPYGEKPFQRSRVQTQTCRKTSSGCLRRHRNHKNPTLLPSTLPAADSVSRETKQNAHSTADFILAARGLPFIPHRYIYTAAAEGQRACQWWRCSATAPRTAVVCVCECVGAAARPDHEP